VYVHRLSTMIAHNYVNQSAPQRFCITLVPN
jgi:hypothetical protein